MGMGWIAALFPYRAHLEDEIDYLRGQLAQKQRRIDELQDRMVFAPPVRAKDPVPTAKASKIAPRGWDEYRRAVHGKSVEDAGEEAPPAAQAEAD